MEIVKPSKGVLKKAIKIINNGGVVICPTDTVYGFLADARNKKAVDKIFKIKKRPKSKPLPVFVENLKMAGEIVFIDGDQAKILKKFWPGKYTFILKRKSNEKLYSVDKKTIAVRIPKYKFLNDLLKKINRPLVQTSVNLSGKPPLTKMVDIINFIGMSDIPMLIVDAGDLKKSKPSKVLDLTSKHLTMLR